MTDKQAWVVTTAGDRPLGDVEQALADAGFTVEEVLGEIGCITGTGSEEVAERVRAIPGVADVSPPPSADIGPPGSPVTW